MNIKNKQIKKDFLKQLHWNFDFMNDKAHVLLDVIRKDEPNWTTDSKEVDYLNNEDNIIA